MAYFSSISGENYVVLETEFSLNEDLEVYEMALFALHKLIHIKFGGNGVPSWNII